MQDATKLGIATKRARKGSAQCCSSHEHFFLVSTYKAIAKKVIYEAFPVHSKLAPARRFIDSEAFVDVRFLCILAQDLVHLFITREKKSFEKKTWTLLQTF